MAEPAKSRPTQRREARDERIAKHAANKVTAGDIANMVGVTRGSVVLSLRRQGFDFDPATQLWSKP